jgi:hypothetical protein
VWCIDPRGTARTLCDDGRKIVVRQDPCLGDSNRWQIIVQGNQGIFPFVYKTRDKAIAQAELWIQLKEIDARCRCQQRGEST